MTRPVFLHRELGGATVGSTVSLGGDEGRHAVVVRRIRPGEELELTDGVGMRLTCVVEDVTKTSLHARVLAVDFEARRAPRVTVVQAIPKGERAELAVEVLTEIGVDVIVPWAATRSVGVWRGERAAKSLAKWRSAAREAAKQSRRSWFPEVTEMASTADVVDLLASADLAMVLHEEASVPIRPVVDAQTVVLVVGPEGGIASEELAAFHGAEPVRLGPTVLRTSTAGVAAVAALLAGSPRWA